MPLPSVLLDGYSNFRTGRYSSEAERYLKLGEGAQKPKTMIIACCDSRAAPETIFDAGPGVQGRHSEGADNAEQGPEDRQ